MEVWDTMGFFSDLKEDLSQVVNDLKPEELLKTPMPDINQDMRLQEDAVIKKGFLSHSAFTFSISPIASKLVIRVSHRTMSGSYSRIAAAAIFPSGRHFLKLTPEISSVLKNPSLYSSEFTHISILGESAIVITSCILCSIFYHTNFGKSSAFDKISQ